MAQKSIYEYDAKMLLASQLPKYFPEFDFHNKLAIIECDTDLDKLITENPDIIKLLKTGSNSYAVLIFGYSPSDTRNAASVLAKGNLEGTEVLLT